MKKIHSSNLEKLLMLCGFSLTLTVLGFWHQHQTMKSMSQMKGIQLGVSTCFTRINQSFTAVMIKDLKSPYINRNFMGLSDECLGEVSKKGKSLGALNEKAQKLFHDLNTEVFWFHEKVTKVLAPIIANPQSEYNVQSIANKYESIENLKLDIMDQIELSDKKAQSILNRDEVIVIFSFFMFFSSILFLAAREIRFIKRRKAIENSALSLLNIGDLQVTSKIEELVSRTLSLNEMPILSQVFRDFYQTTNVPVVQSIEPMKKQTALVNTKHPPELDPKFIIEQWVQYNNKSHISMNLQSDSIKLEPDFVEQVLYNASSFFEDKTNSKNVLVSINGTVEKNNYQLRFFAPDILMNATDLNYFSSNSLMGTNISLFLVILKELCLENGVQFNLSNKANEHGKMLGTEMSFAMPLINQVQAKSLKNLFKGSKKELKNQLRDAQA